MASCPGAQINCAGTCVDPGAGGCPAPTVTVVDPSDGSIGVPLNKMISAAFNHFMDCTTLTPMAFTLKRDTTRVPGAVTCIGNSATFTPASPLAAATTYVAKIAGGSAGAKDLGGGALAADYVWTFSTFDTTAPVVTSVNPANGATGVCPNEAIQATFDDAMAPATLTASFTLQGPVTPVTGVVSYDPLTHTATFTPASALLPNTSYVATVSTGAKDDNGNALAVAKVWRFTTGTVLCQAMVNLRSLSHFVAVAGAGLTNSNSGGTTTLNGDVGLSPAATCLGDGSPCTAVNPVINGTLYANDPAGVAAATKVDLTSAYVDATGRPPGTTVNDLSGMTLAPGVVGAGCSPSGQVTEHCGAGASCAPLPCAQTNAVVDCLTPVPHAPMPNA